MSGKPLCTVTTVPLTLSLGRGKQEQIARKGVALLAKQAAANLDGAGGSLGTKTTGAPVTLKQTGDLFSKVDYRENPDDLCSVEFRRPYASFVFARYPGATELSPPYLRQLENECKTLIEEGAVLTEGES